MNTNKTMQLSTGVFCFFVCVFTYHKGVDLLFSLTAAASLLNCLRYIKN